MNDAVHPLLFVNALPDVPFVEPTMDADAEFEEEFDAKDLGNGGMWDIPPFLDFHFWSSSHEQEGHSLPGNTA